MKCTRAISFIFLCFFCAPMLGGGVAFSVDPPPSMTLLPRDGDHLFSAIFEGGASNAFIRFNVGHHDPRCVTDAEHVYVKLLQVYGQKLLACFELTLADVTEFARHNDLGRLQLRFQHELNSCSERPNYVRWEFNCFVDVVYYYILMVRTSLHAEAPAFALKGQAKLYKPIYQCVGKHLAMLMQRTKTTIEAYEVC